MPEVNESQYRLLDNYPIHLTMDTQFGDMDLVGHINNVAIAGYYDNARARFQLDIFNRRDFFHSDSPYIMVSVESTIKFFDECHFPDPVVVGSALSRVGNSSYVVKQALFQNDRCLGLCSTAMVLLREGKPVTVPDDVRERMSTQLMIKDQGI